MRIQGVYYGTKQGLKLPVLKSSDCGTCLSVFGWVAVTTAGSARLQRNYHVGTTEVVSYLTYELIMYVSVRSPCTILACAGMAVVIPYTLTARTSTGRKLWAWRVERGSSTNLTMTWTSPSLPSSSRYILILIGSGQL